MTDEKPVDIVADEQGKRKQGILNKSDEAVQEDIRRNRMSSESSIEMMMMQMGSMGNPLHQKMNSEHITKILDLAGKQDERQFEISKNAMANEKDDKSSKRRFVIAVLFILIAFYLVFVWIFSDQKDIIIPASSGFFGTIAGFLGGWGYGKKNTDDD